MRRDILRTLALALVAGACTTRLPIDEGQSWPCSASTDCTGGWVCGVEKRCHPAAPGPWACRSDTDCFGIHCGLDAGCVDLSSPQPWPCDFARELAHLRADCSSGWRCGRENTCHPVGEAGPFACLGDSDCEGGWRCARDGGCRDARDEIAASGTLAAQKLSPFLFDTPPDLVSSAFAHHRLAVTLAHGARLDHLRIAWSADAGEPPPQRATFALDAPATELVALGDTAWALCKGAVVAVDWLPDGGAQWRLGPDAGPRAEHLTFLKTAFDPDCSDGPCEVDGTLAAWSADGAAILLPDGGWTFEQPAGDAGVPLLGLTAILEGQQGPPGVVAAVTALGIHQASFDGTGLTSGWVLNPIDWSDAGFEPGSVLPQYKLSYYGDSYELLVGIVSPDGGAFVLMSPDDQRTGDPFRTCPDGGAFVGGVILGGSSAPAAALTRCRAGDGDLVYETNLGLQQIRTVSTERAVDSPTPPYVQATVHGQLTVPGEGSFMLPLGASAPATGFEPGGALRVMTPAQFEFDTTPLYALHDGFGLLPRPPAALPEPCRARPMQAADLGLTAAGTFGVFDRDVVDLVGPRCVALIDVVSGNEVQAAAVLPEPARGTALVVVSYEGLLYAAGVPLHTSPDAGPPPATATLALSPFGFVGVKDLALLPGDATARAHGYALSTAGVVALTAYDFDAWDVQPLALPDGQWQALLDDGVHARLAYDDGRVFTLPGLYAVAEPLPAPSPPLSFFTAAGVDVAVDSRSAWGLAPNPDGGPVAVWRPLALAPSRLDGRNADAGELAARSIFQFGDHAWLLTGTGALYRFGPDGGFP